MRIQFNKLGLEVPKDAPYCSKAYVVRFCKQCGTEFVGSWIYSASVDKTLTQSRKSQFKEFRSLDAAKKCPICNKEFSNDLGYYAAFDSWGSFFSNTDGTHGFDELVEARDNARQRHRQALQAYGFVDTDLTVDLICNTMQSIRLAHQQNDAETRLDRLISQYETSAPTEIISGHSDINGQLGALKEYILLLIQTETSVLSLAKRLRSLYALRFDTDWDAYRSTLLPLFSTKQTINTAEADLKTYRQTLSKLQSKKLTPVKIPEPKEPIKPTEPLYEKPGLFNKKRVLAENAERKAKYEQSLRAYERKMVRYQNDLDSRNQKIALLTKEQEEQHQQDIDEVQCKINNSIETLETAKHKLQTYTAVSPNVATPEKAHKALMDSEILQAEKLLQKAIHCKHQLYNYNIIFGKYRNLVALSTIYEYLMSGRCETLGGTAGAYNLYESETRANIIISQLNNVLESLESLKENQYMVYNAIQKVNSNLERLESTMKTAVESLSNIDANAQTMTQYMEKVAQNSDVIAHNTAVTAYYSKINAELTDALGYMVALR